MHDLSTLFAVIQGFTELARTQTDADGQLAQDLQSVLDATRRARSLAGTLSHDTGDADAAHVRCDLGPLVHETIEMLHPVLPANVEVRVELAVEEPIVQGDPLQIRRALLNVVTNAVHAMPPEGGIVDVEIRAVRDYHPSGPVDTISIVVDDDGCGMDAETLRRVCDCLYTTRREQGGTGLGMWTVKRVMAAHRGFVHVQSVPRGGTTVRLGFPRLEERRG